MNTPISALSAPDTPAAPPPSREQLLYWLHEAAEIEHHLMCCYLYAAFSLKREDAAWSTAQAEAVARWRQAILSVAYDEMAHLCLVGNLMQALGAAPHFGRPALPVDGGPYPAGFVIRLGGFCAATVEHFKYLERPHGAHVEDGAGFEPTREYRRHVPAERLSPGPRDYATVGDLYALLSRSLQACAVAIGERALFCGDPRLQVDATLAPLAGVIAITDLASAQAAIRTIVTQGEGAGHEQGDSHFMRFSAIGEQLAALAAADPAFAPAWPVADNPVMNPPVVAAADRVHVSHPLVARWLDIGNALYTTSLRCLLQGFAATERTHKATWLGASFALMRALVPVGQGLAARPAHASAALPHAGLTFTPLRTLATLPQDHAPRVLAERLGQLRQRAAELPVVPVAGERTATWDGVIALLARQQAAIAALDGYGAGAGDEGGATAVAGSGAAGTSAAPSPAAAPVPAPDPSSDPSSAPAPAPAVETAVGRDITIHFEGQRCIHARHCVLEAPTVFLANTPGEWIHPDTLAAETLAGIALECPSGAIRFTRHDGGAEETAPPVNTLRVRENGPYAVRAALRIAGVDDGYRATLCRCGQSRRKPWCDGSHNGVEGSAPFVASGEPATGDTTALPQRDGVLDVTPLANGPLQVRGNVELLAGTGRCVARFVEARLCRCGHSRSKPYCDGSHIAAGFTAAGA